MSRRWLLGLVLALSAVSASALRQTPSAPSELSDRLTDQQFWDLVTGLSEPGGYFDSDNLISNEDTFQTVIPELIRRIPAGGVYLGVGPEQNFPYIIAVRPKLAFITDIRRGNLHVQLLYKALIERSVSRAEFLSRLFARRLPAGSETQNAIEQLLGALSSAPVDRRYFEETLSEIVERLTKRHGFALESGDIAGLRYVYEQFVSGGPSLRFVSSRPGNWYPTFAELQVATDGQGVRHGYLATEDAFRQLKAMEERNAIVPVVGNFGGPKALRAIGAYVASHHAVVSVFYTSNVERYLFQGGLWPTFIGNVAALPLDENSTFIRSCFDNCSSFGGSRSVTLLGSMQALIDDVRAARVRSYGDVLDHSRGR